VIEIAEREKVKENFYKNTSVEQAKEILRKSYNECYRLYPKDTLFVLNTYLNELGTIIQLYDGQKEFLKRLILKRINIKDHENQKNPE
jgi:hypothetical protein